MALVKPGDRVVLVDVEQGRRWVVTLDGKGARKIAGLGIVDPARLAGLAHGASTTAGSKVVAVFPPRLSDVAATVRRKAQVILPKDASRILFELGVAPGDRVFECGIGSGATTLLLAAAVGTGRVVVQELREEFAEWAFENLKAAGLQDAVEVHMGDLTAGLAAGVKGPFNAALLDVPEPWLALPHLWPHLLPGAALAAYCPQVSQMETTVRALRALDTWDVRAMELIERAWDVKERGSRPSFEGLGHTGFLVFARKVGRPPD